MEGTPELTQVKNTFTTHQVQILDHIPYCWLTEIRVYLLFIERCSVTFEDNLAAQVDQSQGSIYLRLPVPQGPLALENTSTSLG